MDFGLHASPGPQLVPDLQKLNELAAPRSALVLQPSELSDLVHQGPGAAKALLQSGLHELQRFGERVATRFAPTAHSIGGEPQTLLAGSVQDNGFAITLNRSGLQFVHWQLKGPKIIPLAAGTRPLAALLLTHCPSVDGLIRECSTALETGRFLQRDFGQGSETNESYRSSLELLALSEEFTEKRRARESFAPILKGNPALFQPDSLFIGFKSGDRLLRFLSETIEEFIGDSGRACYVKSCRGCQSMEVFRLSRANRLWIAETQDAEFAEHLEAHAASSVRPVDGGHRFALRSLEDLTNAMSAPGHRFWMAEHEIDTARVEGRRTEFRFLFGRSGHGPFRLAGLHGKHFLGEAGGKMASSLPTARTLLKKVICERSGEVSVDTEAEYVRLVRSVEGAAEKAAASHPAILRFDGPQIMALDFAPSWFGQELRYGLVESHAWFNGPDRSVISEESLRQAHPAGSKALRDVFARLVA